MEKLTCWQLLVSLVTQAGEEINWPVDESTFDQVALDLLDEYDFVVTDTDEVPLTIETARVIVDAVEEWQKQTKLNHK